MIKRAELFLLAVTMLIAVLLSACGDDTATPNSGGASSGATPTTAVMANNTPMAGTSGKTKIAAPKGACATASTSKTEDTGTPKFDQSGTLSIDGSSALLPLVSAVKDDYAGKTGGKVTINPSAGGSGKGLSDSAAGNVQIGMSDVYACEKLKPEDAGKIVDHIVAVVGFAMVINPNLKVDSLTKTQMKDIWTGKITNWKDVGGTDQAIVLVNRPSSSGTRTTWKNLVLDGADEATGKALTEDNSGTVKQTVISTDGAAGYLALSYLDNTIKTLKLDGVEANSDNIANGKYSVWSYEHMYTNGPASGATKDFLAYILSADVQGGKLKDKGFISVSSMQVER